MKRKHSETDCLKLKEIGLGWIEDCLNRPPLDRYNSLPLVDVSAQDSNKILTWNRMIKIEPRLASLYAIIGAVRDNPSENHFCANRIWYHFYKPILTKLVGWTTDGSHPELCNRMAYDIAYEKCYGQLPPCRNCVCL